MIGEDGGAIAKSPIKVESENEQENPFCETFKKYRMNGK